MAEPPLPFNAIVPRGSVVGNTPVRTVARLLGPLLALAVVAAIFAGAERFQKGSRSQFLTMHNARTIAAPTATIAVAALGMTVVIIAGGIDLSAGTALSLSATVLAWSLMQPALARYNPLAAITLAIATGSACGLLNGALVSWLRVVPFIVTLGTMRLFLGLGNMLSHQTTVRPDRVTQVPKWLDNFLSIRTEALHWEFPYGVWIVLVLGVITAAVLHWKVFGRRVFALGSNETATRLCGINVPAIKIAVYTLGGLFFGLAGVFQFSRLSVGEPTSGRGLELEIIAAVVIGGGSLNGGRGSILGTLTGAAIMGVIDNGCILLGLSNPVQDVVLGVIIVAAVAIDQWRQGSLAIR